MSAMSGTPYSDLQRREAAEWFVIIRAEDAPEAATLQAWLRWLEASEGNRLAFEAIAQAWHATPRAALAAQPDAHELAADGYDGELTVAAWRQQAVRRDAASVRRRRRFPQALAAALAACGLVAALLLAWRQPQRGANEPAELVTRAGEQLEITLADGSRVWLGAQSALLVSFDSEARKVRLRTGEAYFSVRRDHRRPFQVHSAAGTITAVGTAFDVRSLADRVTVVVTEGVVSVAGLADARDARDERAIAVRIHPGQQITIQAHQPVSERAIVASPSPGERARWREGVFVYRDEPLRDVVADVARYAPRPIEITGAAAGELHFSGVVYRDAIEEWASALPESFPVTLEAEGERLILRTR